MRHLASVVHAVAGICALLIACGSHRRDFSGDLDSAGRGGADERPRRAAVAPDVSSSGAAGEDVAGAPSLPAFAGAGGTGTAGAAGAPTAALAGSAGTVPPDGLAGQSGSSPGQAGAPAAGAGDVPQGSGGSPSSGGSEGSGGAADSGGAAGTAGAAGVGGATELPEEGTSGAPWAPAAELCPTTECTGARDCQYRLTVPAVAGEGARVTWTLPAPSDDYVVEKYDASGCLPVLAIDGVQTASVSWEIASTSVCIVQLAIHRQTWSKLDGNWPTECTHPSVEVSP